MPTKVMGTLQTTKLDYLLTTSKNNCITSKIDKYYQDKIDLLRKSEDCSKLELPVNQQTDVNTMNSLQSSVTCHIETNYWFLYEAQHTSSFVFVS